MILTLVRGHPVRISAARCVHESVPLSFFRCAGSWGDRQVGADWQQLPPECCAGRCASCEDCWVWPQPYGGDASVLHQ